MKSVRLTQGRENFLGVLFERGEIAFDDGPDLGRIDSKVFVDQDIAHADDVVPGDFRMAGLESRGESPASFAHNFEMMDDPNLNHLILLESGPIGSRLLFNSFDRF